MTAAGKSNCKTVYGGKCMEKTKKRLVTSAIVAAIILAVVICGTVFSQNTGVVKDPVSIEVGADGVITGVYNAPEDAQTYYQDLITNQGYTPVDSQDKFNEYFASGTTKDSGKYALNPSVEFTAQSAKYLKNVVIDGCGAKVNLNINASEAFSDASTIGSSSTTGIEELGLGANTMFYHAPIALNEQVYIKPYGGLADYAVNTTVRNIEFNLSSATASHNYSSFGSILIGGVFGIMSNSSATNCSFTTKININYTYTLNPYGGGPVEGNAGARSRVYDLTLSFGSLAGYVYESTISDSSLYIDPTTSIYIKAEGKKGGWYTGNQGTPRAVIGGLIGIAQNNNTIKNIAISGAGALTADPGGSEYYTVEGSAKLGIAGGLVGIVADSENQADFFMLKAEGNTHIYNIVSTWSGSITMWGIVDGSVSYTLAASNNTTVYGALVGIKGKYSYGEGQPASAPNSDYLHGIYKLYSGDTLPSGNAVSYSYVKDASDANVNYSAAGIEFSNVRITEDGQEWLSVTGDKKVDISFNESGLNITYDVSSPEYEASRAILWEYVEHVISGEQTTTETTEAWNVKNEGGSEKIISSYEDAVKTFTVTVANNAVLNRRYDFVTGYSAYYRVDGESGFGYEDKLTGSVGTRTYNVSERPYDGNVLAAPTVQLYMSSDYSGSPVATSADGAQWVIRKNGSGADIAVGDNQTKNVGTWYMSLRNTEDEGAGYLYTATDGSGKNYVAYKNDNALVSDALGETKVTTRNYVYTITQKIITPSIVEKTPEELIYDNAAKIFSVNFGEEICGGDTVTPKLVYYTVDGETLTTTENATNAGNYRVKIESISNANYALSSDQITRDFTITKRVLNSTIDDSVTQFTYNAEFQAPGVTIANQIPGVDQSAVVSVTYKRNNVIDSSGNAGDYVMTVDLTTSAKANYELEGDTELSFTIVPAKLEYTGASEYSFVYDSLGVDYDKFYDLEENPISVGNASIGDVVEYDVYFRPYIEGDDTMDGYDPSAIVNAGVYDCMIYAKVSNYEEFMHKIKVTITPAQVSFGINRVSGTPDEYGNYTYTGKEVSFTAHYSGIGYIDLNFIDFETKIYPAVYESGEWKIVEGSEGVSSVVNAGNYIVVIEQTEGADIDKNANYDTASNPGTRQLAFTINKATLTWQFSGEGLEYSEESGKYSAEYNGQTFTLSLEGGDLESQLAEGDKGKYSLTGNVEYIRTTPEGDYSVGTNGVRDAGNYIVSPEVTFAEGTPELFVNYDIKGGLLEITQRVVTIVIKDISVPYGTHFDEITGESFSNMWYYAEGSKEFLPEDGNMLTFYLRDIPMEETPVRGTYPYTFLPSLVNPNATNYEIIKVYEAGDNAYCTITGLELKLEVVVTDKDGAEVAVYPVDSGASFQASALYYGGDYNVTVRATNLEEDNPGIEWLVSGYKFKNVADSDTVTFELTAASNNVYYIGEDKSATGESDGIFSLKFDVNKRNVQITPVDVEVEYGNEFVSAGVTYGGDGFAEGEQDNFEFKCETVLGENVGDTSEITATLQSGDESNYNFEYNKGTAIRVARVLKMTFNNRDKVYGDDTLAIGEGDYVITEGSIVGEDDPGLAYVLTKDGETYTDVANLAAGTYTIGATATNTNYTIVVENSGEFTVNPKAVDVTLTSATATYDKGAHPVTAKINGLIEGDEGVTATVQYLKDGQPITGEPVYAGTYTAQVTGFSTKNYSAKSFTEDATVTIDKVDVTVTVLPGKAAYGTGVIVPVEEGAYFTSDNEMFNGDDLDPYYIYDDGSADVAELFPGEYAGSLSLGFNGPAGSSYNVTFTKADLTVGAADLAEVARLEEESSVYDGNVKTINVINVQSDLVTVVITKDGKAVESVVDAGTYTVKVTSDSENYFGEATLTYTVEKAQLDVSFTGSKVYDGVKVDLASLVDKKYGEVSFTITKDGESVDEIKGAGNYSITVTAGENSNYTGSVEGIVYTITKANVNAPTRNDLTVTAFWNGFTITDKNGVHPVLITLTEGDWDGATDSITGLMPETEYTVYVKFAGDDNYVESGVFSMTVTTGKKVAAVLDPDDITYTVYYNRIVVTVDGDDSYAYSKDGGKTWQDSNTLSGLKANTEYSVSVKIKESASSGESNVVTKKIATGGDPAAFNDALNSFGDTVTAADLDKYEAMMDAYDKLADGDKAAIDSAKLEKLQSSYKALVAEVNGDVIAAQNVARKAAGKGAAAAAASVLAVVVAAIVAKKKFVF